MNTVNFKLTGINSKIIPTLIVDNQVIKLFMNEFGSYEGMLETDKDELEITLTSEHELNSNLWWLYSLIAFIVSVLGIFNPFYDRKCIAIDCSFKLHVNKTSNIKFKFNTLKKQQKAVEYEADNDLLELKNVYSVNKKCKRRWLFLFIIKIIAWVAIAIFLGKYISNII